MSNLQAVTNSPKFHHIQGSMSILAVSFEGKYKLWDNRETRFISLKTYDSVYGYYAFSGCKNKIVVVKSNNKFGLIDAVTGKEIISPDKSPIIEFTDAIYPDFKPLKLIINGKEEILYSVPLFTDARWGYRDKLNPVIYYYTRNNETYTLSDIKMGYCDSDGKEVIPPIFDQASSFIDGVAIVIINNKWGAINLLGENIIPAEFDNIENICSGFYKVQKKSNNSNLYGILNNVGLQVIPCKYDTIIPFDRHRCVYERAKYLKIGKDTGNKNFLYGIADKAGKEILPMEYLDIEDECHERFKVYPTHDKAGLADSTGSIIIPAIYNDIYSYRYDADIILVFSKNKCGLVNSKNQTLIPPTLYNEIGIENMHNKLFFFGIINKKGGLITKNGKIILPVRYEEMMVYREKDDNTFVVKQNGQWMHIDIKGNIIETYEKNPYIIEEIKLIQHIDRD